jgi:hypothetical protein
VIAAPVLLIVALLVILRFAAIGQRKLKKVAELGNAKAAGSTRQPAPVAV